MQPDLYPRHSESPSARRAPPRFDRVAIVHEWLTIPGGSEQVVKSCSRCSPRRSCSPPYTTPLRGRRDHRASRTRLLPQPHPGRGPHYPKLLPLMDRAFRSFDLSRFDLVISSNHACAKNVRTPPGTCTSATATRRCAMHGMRASSRARTSGWRRGSCCRRCPASAPPGSQRGAASWPDVFVANSRHVAERIGRHYGRTAEVVHPPVDVEHFSASKPARGLLPLLRPAWCRTSGRPRRSRPAHGSTAPEGGRRRAGAGVCAR